MTELASFTREHLEGALALFADPPPPQRFPEWIGRSVLATGGVSTGKTKRLHFNHARPKEPMC
jgi:hypothetical protein